MSDIVPKIRNAKCRIHEIEYLEATPERVSDNEIASLVNKILIVCEEVETGAIGGGTLSAEDIAAITGIDQPMTPRQMIDFVDRLRAFQGEFIMPIPESGLLPLDDEFVGDPIRFAEAKPSVPREETFESQTAAHSLGKKFAQRRKEMQENKETT